jgi:predicted O-linked N-acetylglucosamine transferase (SPINDLY family)
MAHYHEIDMALDPFPYSGGLTTCEALWMGVPVISMLGETFAGRHSASHLRNVGLDDWVAETAEEYLALAEKHSRDLEKLAELRASLRERMATSPLCDGRRYTRDLEAVYRQMWREWCDTAS